MNNKILIAVIVLGILVIVTLGVFFLLKKDKDKMTGKKEEVVELQSNVANPVQKIVYDGKTFSGAVNTVIKGKNIAIENETEENIIVQIVGPQAYQLPVNAKNSTVTPKFELVGNYEIFIDKKPEVRTPIVVAE